MISLLTNKTHELLPEKIKDIIKKYPYTFNPSFFSLHGVNYLAIRVFSDVSKSIQANLYIWKNNAPNAITFLDLSEHFLKSDNISKVADPKLFVLDNVVWCNFNTGHPPSNKESNKLCLFKLYGDRIGKLQCCNYSKRTKVEKNWGFFYDNKQLYALYSIQPLTILKAIKADGNEIKFEPFYESENSFSGYTIGTPLYYYKGKHLFIAHKKLYFRGKRTYIGRPFSLDFESKTLKSKKHFLFHSIKSLFGNKKKFNPNLISCSYFSGISGSGGSIILNYGINDISWNNSLLKINKLWA